MTDCAQLEALLARVPEGTTPGPWIWWTSNSWRRLHHETRGLRTSVLEPFVASDGHPDCSVSREDMALIELAPDLADALRTALANISDITRERDAAREALRWYGEQASGCRKIGSAGDPFRNALDRDGGQLARATLTGEQA